MKISKMVAEALASKTYRKLQDLRKKAIDSYEVTSEDEEYISSMIKSIYELKEKMTNLEDLLRNYVPSYRTLPGTTVEEAIKITINWKAQDEIPQIPSRTALVEDFIIESADSNEVDEIIERIISKYI